MLKDTDIALIAHLRSDGRKKVTEISRAMNIPVTTLYDRLAFLEEKTGMKHTTLLDFQKIGYKRVAYITFKVHAADRNGFEEHLTRSNHLNSLYRINHGYDFLAHMIFRDANEMKDFLESAEAKFRIENWQIFETIDEIKKENFMAKR